MNLVSECSINVRPHDRQFELHSNACDYFEIGKSSGSDVWLEGQMVGPNKEFLFNGRLFCKSGGQGTVIDNFPKGNVPSGWSKRPNMHGEGYELLDSDGEVIFAYRVEGNICHVTVGLYNSQGGFVVGAGQGGLVLQGIPAQIGRGGIVFG